MEPIRVRLPSGQVIEIPADTPPELVREIIGASGGPAAPASAAGAPQDTSATLQGSQKRNPLFANVAQAIQAAKVNRVDPMLEAAERGGVALGARSQEDLARRLHQNALNAQEYAETRRANDDTGFDWAGLGGTLAADVGTLGVLGKLRMLPGFMRNPQTLPDLAKTGAVAGGISAGMGPVPNSEGLGGADYAVEKAKQTGVGTLLGAAATPPIAFAATKLIGAGGEVGGKALEFLRRIGRSPTPATRTVGSRPDLELYLEARARDAGVDWAAVPENVRQSLRDATTRATRITGQLPDDAIRNRLLAEANELPGLTLGQATRSPVEFSREANNPDPGLREYFATQRNAATQRLAGMEEGARSPYQVGTELARELEAQAATRRAAINALYGAARDDQSGYMVVQNTTDFARNAIRELKQSQLMGELPPDLARQLQLLSSEGGRFKLSARQAARMLQNINGMMSQQRDPRNAALGVVKTELNKLLDDPVFRDPAAGASVINKFREASSARRSLGQWEDSSRAIADLTSRTPRTPPEKIVDRYVMSGSVDDLQGLWKTLPLTLRNEVKRAFVADVAGRAKSAFGSQATNAASAVKFLRQYPPEKLRLMFTDKELASLRGTLEYLRLVTEAPPGSFVNRSNSLVDLKDFLGGAGQIPVFGPMIGRPLQEAASANAGRAARTGTDLLAPDQLPRNALMDLGENAAPYVSRGAPVATVPVTTETLRDIAEPDQ